MFTSRFTKLATFGSVTGITALGCWTVFSRNNQIIDGEIQSEISSCCSRNVESAKYVYDTWYDASLPLSPPHGTTWRESFNNFFEANAEHARKRHTNHTIDVDTSFYENFLDDPDAVEVFATFTITKKKQ